MNALEVAKNMELDSIRLYSEAAAKTKSLVGRKMFEMVIEDEKRRLEMVVQLIGSWFMGEERSIVEG